MFTIEGIIKKIFLLYQGSEIPDENSSDNGDMSNEKI